MTTTLTTRAATRVVVALLMVSSVVEGDYTLTIIHTNDIHARYEQFSAYSGPCSDADAAADKCFGGYARLVTAVGEMRQQYPDSLLLDAGDQYQGTLWFYKYAGNVTSFFTNLLGYDAMTLGNHEFDLGPQGLLPFLNAVKFPIVSSNVNGSLVPGFMDHINKSLVFNVSGNLVGIVGYTTTDTPIISNPGDVKFNDVMTSVKNEVNKLESQNISIIIALGHAGYAMDQQVATIPGVDVVVGGHSHTFLYPRGLPQPSNDVPEGDYPTVVTRPDGTKALVVQDYTMAKYLGVIHVTFDDAGRVTNYTGKPWLLNASVPENSTTLQELKPWKEGVEEQTRQVVGRTLVHLEGDRTVCRKMECNMGNLITDAMLHANLRNHKNGTWNDVSIVLMNGGGIRSSIEPGNITIANVLSVQPFRNTIDLIHIKGKHLRAALEHSVERFNPCETTDLAGAFLQVAGLRVQYDMRRPARQRVVSANVLCTDCLVPHYVPLDDEVVYKISLPSFVADGGDGYTVIKENIIRREKPDTLDSEVTIGYLKFASPVIQGLEGRITYFDNSDVCNSAPTSIHSCLSSGAEKVRASTALLILAIMWSVFKGLDAAVIKSNSDLRTGVCVAGVRVY